MAFNADTRYAILIDAAYLFRATQTVANGQIDYEKIINNIINPNDIQYSRLVAFVVDTPSIMRKNDKREPELLEQQERAFLNFRTKLEHLGYEVICCKPRWGGKFYKKDVGVHIAVTAMQIASRVDAMLLVSGNGDLVFLVDTLKQAGTKVDIMAYKNYCDRELIKASNDFYDLGSYDICREGTQEKVMA